MVDLGNDDRSPVQEREPRIIVQRDEAIQILENQLRSLLVRPLFPADWSEEKLHFIRESVKRRTIEAEDTLKMLRTSDDDLVRIPEQWRINDHRRAG